MFRIHPMDDVVTLKRDFLNTVYRAWFESGDIQFPETFPEKVNQFVSDVLRKVTTGRMSVSEGYTLAARFGSDAHAKFYSPVD